MDKLIISNFYKDKLLGFHLVHDEIEMIYDFSDSEVGNVYCGIIKDVTKNLSSAFVEFANRKKGFLKIEQEVKSGDKILVQVKADPIKSKDYLLTTKLELSNDELREVERKYKYAAPKSCLYKANYLMDICNKLSKNGTEIITDNNLVSQNLEGAKIQKLLYNSNSGISIENTYRLGKIIKDVLSKKVWMNSGAYLVIEHTEALTSIDVNSGKNVTKKNRDENIKDINFEAAEYIMKHLKLRNISGIIIVDFINMREEYYEELTKHMTELSKLDNVVCNIVGFTELGLLEITRKKNKKSLNEILSEVGND